MRNFKFLTLAFAALFLSATFSACNDEDKAKPNVDYDRDYDWNNGNNNSGNNNSENNNSGNNNSGNNNSGNSGNNNSNESEYSDDRDYSKDTKKAVDLGLSVKWATCNVGASKPEEYGSYFAWGETTPQKEYSWSTYKYGSGQNELTKYCTDSRYGKVDNKTVLEKSDDAAAVNWGGAWRMPTKAEQNELLEKCTWTWTTQNGVNGYKVTSKTNGNSIFLPAAATVRSSAMPVPTATTGVRRSRPTRATPATWSFIRASTSGTVAAATTAARCVLFVNKKRKQCFQREPQMRLSLFIVRNCLSAHSRGNAL